jgi:hypothetical protein
MSIIVGSVVCFSVIYYFVARLIGHELLTYVDCLVFTSVLALVVTGGYQVFFWVQRNNYYFPMHCLHCRFDDYVPFCPSWVWPYSIVYTIMLGAVLIAIRSLEDGLYIIFTGIVLLGAHSASAMFFPCTVPPSYRHYVVNSSSTQFLKWIQTLDNKRSSFPSMHCSVGTFVGLLLYPHMPVVSTIFIVLTPTSCLLVKQHQIADTLAGVGLGGAVYLVLASTR